MNTTNKIRERRQVIYNVLKQNLPIKMNASGIAREINRLKIFQYPVSASQVSYAIRDYALRSKCFSIFFKVKEFCILCTSKKRHIMRGVNSPEMLEL